MVYATKFREHIRDILEELGDNPGRSGLCDTPRRVEKMFMEMTYGLRENAPYMTMFDAEGMDQLVTILGIDYWSLCVPSKQHVNVVGGSKPAASVEVGDELWTLSNGRTVKTTVREISKRNSRELVEVVTDSGNFRVTPDHPFATKEGWVEAKNLLGKDIEWTSARSLCRNRYRPKIGYSLGYSIGAMFSDGTTADRYISLVVNDEWFANRFATALEEAFGLEADVEPCSRPSGFTGKDTPGFRVRVVSSYLAQLFTMWAGGDSHHMRQKFPRVVLSSRETMQGFIDGYVDGDGHRRGDRNASVITSGNVEFLQEMAEVLDAKFTASEDGASRLYVSDHWHREGWYNKHGFKQEDHRTDLLESQWVRVLYVERVEAKGNKLFMVYSFKCSPEPTFLIQGFLSHNCEHHLVPFYGKVHVGYIPGEKIVGLSKFGRIVDWISHRPQIQERMTAEIADFISEKASPQGVIVVVEGTHLCMEMRGVKKAGHKTVTSAIRGDVPKDEFFDILKIQE